MTGSYIKWDWGEGGGGELQVRSESKWHKNMIILLSMDDIIQYFSSLESIWINLSNNTVIAFSLEILVLKES